MGIALLVTLDLRRMRKTITHVDRATKNGMNSNERCFGALERMIYLSVIQYRLAPIMPATTGDSTQESMMPPKPSKPQTRHAPEVPTIVIPTTPPTTACVPDTGAEPNVARARNTLEPIRAPNIPTANIDIRELQYPQAQQSGSSISATPFWIASDTPYPRVTAPRMFAKPARRQAVLNGTAPEATLVPHAFATSFAPTPNAFAHIKIAANGTSQFRSCGSSYSPL
mmetsp:Transcript_21515/g.52705  ORF Transcript_21515/g.52705 Transcript_21515/m.52705 type:complete len:226 (-) Transcript_21515:240-917(-)